MPVNGRPRRPAALLPVKSSVVPPKQFEEGGCEGFGVLAGYFRDDRRRYLFQVLLTFDDFDSSLDGFDCFSQLLCMCLLPYRVPHLEIKGNSLVETALTYHINIYQHAIYWLYTLYYTSHPKTIKIIYTNCG